MSKPGSESGSHQEDHGKGGLPHHQGVPKVVPLSALRGAPSRVPEDAQEPGNVVPKGRDHAEEEGSQGRHPQGEEEHRSIHGDLIQAGELGRGHSEQEGRTPPGNRQSGHSSHPRQNQALRQELAGDSSPAGSHGGPDGHLSLTPFCPDQKEVRHVAAGDEQHESHGAQEDPERALHIAHHLFLESVDDGVEAPGVQEIDEGLGVGPPLPDPLQESRLLGHGDLGSDTGTEAGHSLV